MKPSIRQLAMVAIALSLMMNGKPSHGDTEAGIPDDHVGVMVRPGLPPINFWIWAEHTEQWLLHKVEAEDGMRLIKCDFVGNGPCLISFNGGKNPWTLQQTARYKVDWNPTTRQYQPVELPLQRKP
jgi:hypothetical protein